MQRWPNANVKHSSPLPPCVLCYKNGATCDDLTIKLNQTDKFTEILSAHMVVFFSDNMLVMYFLCVLLYVCRTSTQCWISRQMQWIGWTTLSGIQLWCSWTQIPSRVSRTWGRASAQNPGRVPGSYMTDPSNYEKITSISLPVSHRGGGVHQWGQ